MSAITDEMVRAVDRRLRPVAWGQAESLIADRYAEQYALALSGIDLLETRTVLEAAVACGVVPVWQPIETAPKDGAVILLGSFKFYGKDNSLACLMGIEDAFWDDGIWNGWILKDYRPTHWMPLPAAPKAEGE